MESACKGNVQTGSGAHPAPYSMGTEVPSRVKSEWSYTCAPPIRLRGVDRGNFIFAFTGRC